MATAALPTSPPDDVVTAYRKHNEDPFKIFYTKPGNSVHRLGVNPEPAARRAATCATA